ELLSETVSADERLSSLAVLGGVRERARSILPAVRKRAELAVSELCRTFSPEGYGGIVEAFLMLEDRGALGPLPPPPAPPPPPHSTAGATGSVHGGGAGEVADAGSGDAAATAAAGGAAAAGEGGRIEGTDDEAPRRQQRWISEVRGGHD
ncbi:unnamed protein product, partial [Hapterophycus canaliculatus]